MRPLAERMASITAISPRWTTSRDARILRKRCEEARVTRQGRIGENTEAAAGRANAKPEGGTCKPEGGRPGPDGGVRSAEGRRSDETAAPFRYCPATGPGLSWSWAILFFQDQGIDGLGLLGWAACEQSKVCEVAGGGRQGGAGAGEAKRLRRSATERAGRRRRARRERRHGGGGGEPADVRAADAGRQTRTERVGDASLGCRTAAAALWGLPRGRGRRLCGLLSPP